MLVSGSRRSANPSALADEASSHWRSSIATTSPSSASSCKALRTRPRAPGIDRTAAGVLDEEGDLERPGCGGVGRAGRVEHSVEEIPEAGVRKAALRLGWARGEHAQRTPPCGVDGGAPERRLSDPRVAFERDRGRARRDCPPVEERETET